MHKKTFLADEIYLVTWYNILSKTKMFRLYVQKAVRIGDRIDNDIIPANLLGMHTIWIKQGFGKYWNIKQDIEKAEFVVDDLIELCNIL